MTLDLNKPVQTRDGRKARILCTDRKGEYPVIGLVTDGDGEFIHGWTLDGTYFLGSAAVGMPIDLVNVPQEYKALATINVIIDEKGRTFIGATKNIGEARRVIGWDNHEDCQIIMGTLELTIRDGKVVDAKVGPV